MPFNIETQGLALGGTVTGNLIITGTLNTQGNVTFDVLQTTTGVFSAEDQIIIDVTNTEALLVRSNADGGDVLAVNTTTAGVHVTGIFSVSTTSIFTGTTTHTAGLTSPGTVLVGALENALDETPPELFTVAGSSIEAFDAGTLASESITDGAFPDSTNWAGAGEWSDTISGSTTFTFSSTGNGTLTQTSGQMAIAGKNNRWYKLTYTTSSVVDAGGLTMTLTNAFAATAVTLSTTDGTYSVIFQSAAAASSANFVIDITSASGSDVLTLDDVILKEITGGDVIVAGKLTGGGTEGISIDGDGLASITQPILAADGTNLAPSYSFSSNKDHGMYVSGGNLAFARSGTLGFILTSDQISSSVDIHPSVDGTLDLGFANSSWKTLYLGTSLIVGDLSDVGTLTMLHASTTLTMSSGSSQTASSLIPAGAIVYGITTRVTTLVTGPAGYDVGDGSDVDRWGNSILVAEDTTSDATDFTEGAPIQPQIYPAANDVVITTDGVNFTAGVIRVTVHYSLMTASTA